MALSAPNLLGKHIRRKPPTLSKRVEFSRLRIDAGRLISSSERLWRAL